MVRRRFLHLAILVVPVVLALLSSSCDKTDSCRPDGPIGRIEGYLFVGGEPCFTGISIRGVEDTSPRYVGQTVSDSTGWYAFEVPTGNYECRLSRCCPQIRFNEFELGFGNDIEPYNISSGTHRRDLHTGKFSAVISIPQELNDSELAFSLYFDADTPSEEHITESGISRSGLATFDFEIIPPKPARALLEITNLSTGTILPFWLPVGSSKEAALIFEVSAERPTTYSYTLPAPGIISGEIHGSWEIFDDARPTLEAWTNDSIRVAITHPDQSGAFQLAVFETDTVYLRTEIGYIGQWYGGGSFYSATPLRIESGSNVTLDPIIESGVSLYLESPEDTDNTGLYCYLLHADGTRVTDNRLRWYSDPPYHISNLHPGEYYLQILRNNEAFGWCEQYYNQALLLAKADRIEVPADGQTTSIHINLLPGGTIGGKVMTASGYPAQRRPVYAFPMKFETDFEYGAWMDPVNGTFRIAGLPDGSYIVGVRFGWNSYYYYPGTYKREEAELVEITEQRVISNLTWSYPE